MGPVNFSTNESCGLLIERFDSPPVVMMPYNAPYYATLLENWQLAKKVDLLAWKWNGENYDDRSVKLMDRLEERLLRNDIVIRKINMKKFKEEAEALREVYNKAWDKNLGFVPLNDEEYDYQAAAAIASVLLITAFPMLAVTNILQARALRYTARG